MSAANVLLICVDYPAGNRLQLFDLESDAQELNDLCGSPHDYQPDHGLSGQRGWR